MNAPEAVGNGGRIEIATEQRGGWVVMSVHDNGCGMSREFVVHSLFRPLRTTKEQGLGIGLFQCKKIVEAHRGRIEVESEEGKGSIFSLYFPVTREEISAEAVAIAISEYVGKGESILVVDDVREQRDLASGMLRTLNYSVSSVSSGEEAVAYLKEHTADLMVLDMIMEPGMDGLDTYKSVLNIRPKQKAIIVSGFSESDRVKEAQRLGAGAYVKKPYVLERIGIAVRKELLKERNGKDQS